MVNRPLGSGWPEVRQRKIAECLAIMQQQAGVAESRMKSGADWTDRTGHARQGLQAEASLVTNLPMFTRISLELRHTMDYGKWLETLHGAAMGMRAGMSGEELAARSNAGPLAIIHPTAQAIVPVVRAAILSRWRS